MSAEAGGVAEAEQPVARLLVPVLTLGVTIAILSARALSIFLPVMAADLHVSVSAMGQIPSLMLLLAGVLALVAGPLADRYGLRLTLVVGLVSVFVSTVATGLAPNLLVLLAVTLVGAIARAVVLPAAQAVAFTTFREEDARRAIGWVTTGLSVAGLLGIPILTSIAALTSWRVSFFAMGLMALVAAGLLQRTLARDAARVDGRLSLRDLLDSYEPIRRDRPTSLMLVASLLSEIGLWSAMTYFSALLVERHGLGIEAVGWAFLAISIMTFAGNIAAQGRLGRSPRPLMLICRLWCALGLGLAFGLPVSWPVILAIVVIASPTFSMENVATTLVLAASSPASLATALTLRSAGVCIGTAIGGALGGGALAVGGYPAIGALALVILLASTVLAWWSRAGASPPVQAASA
jgi:predicted MFS family arabinose efflux permease